MGKTVPEVLSTARGPYLRPRTQFFFPYGPTYPVDFFLNVVLKVPVLFNFVTICRRRLVQSFFLRIVKFTFTMSAIIQIHFP